jgi:uncharacterized membrane protein YccC
MSLGALRETVVRVAHDAWGFRARSARATACVLLPLAVLCATGHPQSAAVATQGAFAGFYAFDAPYRRRARVVAGLGVALAAAMLLGTWVAPREGLAVAVGAAFAAASAATCLVLRVGPPREYFIVFTFLIAAALPPDPGAGWARAGLVLAGAAGAWLISMAGTLRDARAPERTAVSGALRAVARLLDAVGREGAGAARHRAVLAVQRAQDAVGAAGGAGTPGGAELARRAEAAEALLEAALALMVESSPPLDPAWGRAVDAFAEGAWAVPVIPRSLPPVPAAGRLDDALRAAGSAGWLDRARSAGGDDDDGLGVPRWRAALADLTDPRSPAPAAALRLGAAVAVAGAAGYLLRAEHPTWIPLSAAAVLQGTNVALLRQRAVHRAVGTALGVVVAAGVLAFDPGLAMLVVLVAAFQALTESLVLVMYGAAVVCITALALLLLEIAGVGSVGGLLDARLLDTALGCAIGYSAGLLVWPRRSRLRLAGVQAQAIRAAASAIRVAFGGGDRPAARRDVHVAVVALDAAQRDATGDALATSARTDLGWPVTHAIEQLALVAMALPPAGTPDRPAPPREDAARLDAVLAELAARVEAGSAPPGAPPLAPPPLPDWPRTHRAVGAVCDALSIVR